MRKLTRRGTSGSFLGAALLLLTASAVWACTAQPRIFSLGPQVGPVGLEIILEGQTAASAPVEVRWNSLEGAKIGEGVADFNGNFAAATRIPEASPGVYFLVVRAGDAGVVRTPFEVTGEKAPSRAATDGSAASAAASSSDLWTGFSTTRGAAQSNVQAAQPGDASGIQAALGGTLLAVGVSGLAFGLVLTRRRQLSGAGNNKQS
ncbi:MAG: hypothetical protein ACR2M4_04525 [Actinomycetota bacterium]